MEVKKKKSSQKHEHREENFPSHACVIVCLCGCECVRRILSEKERMEGMHVLLRIYSQYTIFFLHWKAKKSEAEYEKIKKWKKNLIHKKITIIIIMYVKRRGFGFYTMHSISELVERMDKKSKAFFSCCFVLSINLYHKIFI